MSTVGMKKRYTSVMEKIIKNAVSETSKVLETVIAELKADFLRVNSENENLKIRCSQFEEVVKKRSVYRETGTSPDPWIIEKCDKAVQCDFIFHQSEDDPNHSDNEMQSESSFGPIYEKVSSNDSLSFLTTKDTEGNSCNPLDLSNGITTEKTIADYGQNIIEDMVVDRCLDLQFDNIDSNLETPHNSKHKNVPIVLYQHDEQQSITTYETSEVICEKSEAKSKECESISYPTPPTESALYAPQKAVEETIQMDVENELKSGKCSTTDIPDTQSNDIIKPVEDSADGSCPRDKTVTLSEDLRKTSVPTESEQIGTEILDTAVQPASQEYINAKEAQDTLKPVLTPKSQYFLRRQRCSSVTLEDAMLLLDAVSQQKYKSSPPKKPQKKEKNVAKPKLFNITEVTAPLTCDSSNSEEITCIPESLQPHATHRVATDTAIELELDVCPAKMDIKDQNPQESNGPSKPSCTVEAVIDRDVITSTPIKSTQEADSAGLNTEEQHEHQEIMPPSAESTLVTENITSSLTPTKLEETMQTVDTNTISIDIEKHDKPVVSITQPSMFESVEDSSLPVVALAYKHNKLLEMEEPVLLHKVSTDSQNHDPKSLTASPSSKLLSVQSEEGNPTKYLPPPTEKSENATVILQYPTQTGNKVMEFDFTPPIDDLTSKEVAQRVSDPHLQTPTESVEIVSQISGNSSQDCSQSEENDLTVTQSESLPVSSPPFNPLTQHTLLVKLPGDTGNKSSSVVKTITTSSTLSPAQLSAVVSAVRSTQGRTSSTGPTVVTPSGKKALVAVPFSLQSVMRPHHKIIVIPRQCKVPTSQAIAKDKAIVLQQKASATQATTTFISTTDVDLKTTPDEGNCINSMDQQETTSETLALLDPSELINEPSSSHPDKSPCKNTVQIKLNRIPFPVSSAQSVSVTEMPTSPSPNTIVRKKRGRPPLKKKFMPVDSSQCKAQPKEDIFPIPIIASSPMQSSNEATPIQSSPELNAICPNKIQPPSPEQLSPLVAADHSYPQHCMTKSQFLAKLEVSPVSQISKKADITENGKKASLVDRLRSHLKPHIKTYKKAQKPEMGHASSIPSVEKKDPIFALTHETSRPNQDQPSENIPDPVLPKIENKTDTPKTSPATKNVSSKAKVQRKRSPKRNLTTTKTVKRRKLKKTGTSNENIPSGSKLSPMQSKIINSNALLSCVRKGIKKKSFLCKFCRKEFSKKKDIEAHIQVHVGKKPFQCNICHRRFSRTMELSRHLKRHNADKKYQCTSCGKAFIEYNNLKRHTYIHTGEKPFPCPHCPKAFTQSGHMRTHIKNKHSGVEDYQ